jgi:hypothetical protein
MQWFLLSNSSLSKFISIYKAYQLDELELLSINMGYYLMLVEIFYIRHGLRVKMMGFDGFPWIN